MIFFNAEDLRYLQKKIPPNQKILWQCRLAEDGPEMQKSSAQCRRLGKSVVLRKSGKVSCLYYKH